MASRSAETTYKHATTISTSSIDIGSVPQLCDRCSQISFAALVCPTAVDFSRARKALKSNNAVPKFLPFRESHAQNKDFEPQKITIGSLDHVQNSLASCQLCAFIFDAITREGDFPVPKGEELIVRANPDTCYHGYITDSRMDVEGNWTGCYFFLRRLCIILEVASSAENLAYFDHIAQPCRVGAITDDDFPFLFSSDSQDEMHFAGRKRPQTINLHWLKSWIQICDAEHGDDCRLAEEQSGKLFMNLVRMVDVRRSCIQTFEAVNPTEIKFVALSYVWSGSQKLKLSKSTSSELEHEGSLTKAALPQTIADAIDVTREFGVDFIWIDALCIVQDDPNDLREQIASVALIYRSASFTIIAACGNNCSAGLAGLRSGTRKFEQMEVVVIPPSDHHLGMSIVNTCKSYRYPLDMFSRDEEDIDLAVWNTRGWTLQERVLSRRNLVFTEEQAMRICDGAYFCEESYFEHPRLENNSNIRKVDETRLRWALFKKTASAASFQSIDGAVLAISQERFWDKYKTLVTWYTKRSFTYPGDAFDGFRCITDALERLSGEKFLWGHPRSRFGLSLFWGPANNMAPRRRNELTTLPMTNLDTNVTFPSWSWLGWMGRVHCSVGDDRRDSETADILPFYHTSQPLRIHPVYTTNQYDDVSSMVNLKKGLERPSAVLWKPVDNVVVTVEDVMNELPKLIEVQLKQLPDEHVIFFWASSAFFNVKSTKQQNLEQTLDVVNAAGDAEAQSTKRKRRSGD